MGVVLNFYFAQLSVNAIGVKSIDQRILLQLGQMKIKGRLKVSKKCRHIGESEWKSSANWEAGIRAAIFLYAGPQTLVNINTKTNWVAIDVGQANTDNLKKYPFLFTLIYNRYQLKAFVILSMKSPEYNTA